MSATHKQRMDGRLECVSCGMAGVKCVLDFGPQPPSNRYLQPTDEAEPRHPLSLGQCESCGLLQLVNPMPPDMVKARYDWLVYNEPEAHLDDVVAWLVKLPGVGAGAEIHGVTYKDDSTLARLANGGFSAIHRYDAHRDLGVSDPCAGLETIQQAFHPETATHLLRSYGPADIVIARHIIEHAHDPVSFITCAGRMLKPAGYLVLEFPDCTKFVKACDYSFLWEEHLVYFSPFTFTTFAMYSGFQLHEIRSYSYALEDSIVAILQPNAQSNAIGKQHRPQQLKAELRAASNFAERFQEIKSEYRDRLIALRNAGKKVALFGAGHLAAKFLNLFGLKDVVQCVIDDDPHKQGLLMPGSGLPIVGSTALLEQAVDVCLLSLNPTSEQQVLAKYRPFAARGGRFYSIFPLSPLALLP